MQTCKLTVTLLLNVIPSEDIALIEEQVCDKVEELTEIEAVSRVYIEDVIYGREEE